MNYFTRKKELMHHFWQIHQYFADTKDQWARDDPAFLVLLSFWLVGKKFQMILPFYTRITSIRIIFIHALYRYVRQNSFHISFNDIYRNQCNAFTKLFLIFVVSSIGFSFTLGIHFSGFLKLILWVVFVDCIGVGVIIATFFW